MIKQDRYLRITDDEFDRIKSNKGRMFLRHFNTIKQSLSEIEQLDGIVDWTNDAITKNIPTDIAISSFNYVNVDVGLLGHISLNCDLSVVPLSWTGYSEGNFISSHEKFSIFTNNNYVNLASLMRAYWQEAQMIKDLNKPSKSDEVVIFDKVEDPLTPFLVYCYNLPFIMDRNGLPDENTRFIATLCGLPVKSLSKYLLSKTRKLSIFPQSDLVLGFIVKDFKINA